MTQGRREKADSKKAYNQEIQLLLDKVSKETSTKDLLLDLYSLITLGEVCFDEELSRQEFDLLREFKACFSSDLESAIAIGHYMDYFDGEKIKSIFYNLRLDESNDDISFYDCHLRFTQFLIKTFNSILETKKDLETTFQDFIEELSASESLSQLAKGKLSYIGGGLLVITEKTLFNLKKLYNHLELERVEKFSIPDERQKVIQKRNTNKVIGRLYKVGIIDYIKNKMKEVNPYGYTDKQASISIGTLLDFHNETVRKALEGIEGRSSKSNPLSATREPEIIKELKKMGLLN